MPISVSYRARNVPFQMVPVDVGKENKSIFSIKSLMFMQAESLTKRTDIV